MCFSYSVHHSTQSFPLPFDTSGIQIPIPGFFFSGFDHPTLPICTSNERWEMARWGLIPKWAKESQQRLELENLTLNARSETAFEKPSFRDAWERQPCIILSSGFFEWQLMGKQRIPHFIYHKNAPWLYFAGLFEDFHDGLQWQRSFTLLTTQSMGIMSTIHHTKLRMPVMLSENQLQTWLHASAAERQLLCQPKEPDFLQAHEVNPLLNKTHIQKNAPWAIESYQAPQTQLLF